MKRWMIPALIVLLTAALPAGAEPEPITLCLHTPITGAAPIPHHPDRFGQFYFDAVNAEQGGVRGRPVRMLTYDDGYYPAGARAAVERCARQADIALYLGWVGGDTVASVARWTESKHEPYLHGPMPTAASEELSFDASIAPTQEDAQRSLAQLLAFNAAQLTTAAKPVFGMVATNTAWGDADLAAFQSALQARGHALAVVVRVQRDESRFTAAYHQLQSAGVNIVNAAISPNAMIRMASQQPPTYDPFFASASPYMGADVVAEAVDGARMAVLNDPAPAYDPLDPDPRWADEVEEFHRIFDRYSREQNPPRDDFDWMSYLRAKQVHRMLLALEGDYSTEAFLNLFEQHVETPAQAFPTCALDFDTNPTFGQDAAHVFIDEGSRWVQAGFCADDASEVDIVRPGVACDVIALGAPAECRFEDLGAGVGDYAVTVTSATGASSIAGHGACDARAVRTLDLGPGVHTVEARVQDCANLLTRASSVLLAV